MSVAINLYPKQSLRLRSLAIGGAVAFAGAAVLMWKGNEGFVAIAVGLAIIAWGIARGARPLVTIEASSVVLRHNGRKNVPFIEIARVDQLKTRDLELCLVSGAKHTIPIRAFEEADGEWLRRELRKEMRVSASRRRSR